MAPCPSRYADDRFTAAAPMCSEFFMPTTSSRPSEKVGCEYTGGGGGGGDGGAKQGRIRGAERNEELLHLKKKVYERNKKKNKIKEELKCARTYQRRQRCKRGEGDASKRGGRRSGRHRRGRRRRDRSARGSCGGVEVWWSDGGGGQDK